MIETKLKAERSYDSSSMKKSSSRNSESSIHSHMESPHSPLRFHSPLRSDVGDRPAASGVEEDGGGGGERSPKQIPPPPRRSKDDALTKAALGFRVSEVAVCLISFSVMASDKTKGWSGDSFDRYKEYRYCLTVNIIAFVYAAFQAFDLVYTLIKKQHMIRHRVRSYFDFFMDQMASASISMSFLAFVAFAVSSLISGYNLCSRDPA
ncbi:CASP-like protein 4A3, partial [Cucurbita argyrosperma subsp. argyrosperma]